MPEGEKKELSALLPAKRKEIWQVLPAMPSNEGIFQWVPWLENIYSLTTERQAEP